MTVAALIVAAGRGTRAAAGFSGAAPAKQYARLGDQPVLARACSAFLSHPSVAVVQVVIHPDDIATYSETVAKLPIAKLLAPINGGATRQASVLAGLEALAERQTP
ncbi:MAG: NTP transferase domain-containing protein, partial [Hyphomicrobiaceae bacterium]|nr:NTP transferase domain-containing protein [Hyphomicrobiaceae bacterium]